MEERILFLPRPAPLPNMDLRGRKQASLKNMIAFTPDILAALRLEVYLSDKGAIRGNREKIRRRYSHLHDGKQWCDSAGISYGILKRIGQTESISKKAVLDESPACGECKCGSGKTTVLITKNPISAPYKKVGYEDMTVLTFTNKAADEIKSRLAAEPELPADKLRGFGTFHSTALYYLREFLPVEDLGYSKEFLVIDPEELELAYDLIRQHKLKIKYKNRLKKAGVSHGCPGGGKEGFKISGRYF